MMLKDIFFIFTLFLLGNPNPGFPYICSLANQGLCRAWNLGLTGFVLGLWSLKTVWTNFHTWSQHSLCGNWDHIVYDHCASITVTTACTIGLTTENAKFGQLSLLTLVSYLCVLSAVGLLCRKIIFTSQWQNTICVSAHILPQPQTCCCHHHSCQKTTGRGKNTQCSTYSDSSSLFSINNYINNFNLHFKCDVEHYWQR